MSDPTRFDLDDRQRAMLAEMGVRVWWPQRSDAATQVVAADAPAVAAVGAVPTTGVSVAAGAAERSAPPATPAVSMPVHAPATRSDTREPVAPAPVPVQAEGQVFAPLPEGLSSMGWS
jgi:DNA polymerase